MRRRPCLWLDATCLKVREGGVRAMALAVSGAAMIAVAANRDGRRGIVGLHIGPSEGFGRWPSPFWASFLKDLASRTWPQGPGLKDLVRRGPKGVKRVISEAHEGLEAAIRRVIGATWQRGRVHFMRNALAHGPKGQHRMVAAAIRQAFPSPTTRAPSRPGGMSPTNCGPAGPKPGTVISRRAPHRS